MLYTAKATKAKEERRSQSMVYIKVRFNQINSTD